MHIHFVQMSGMKYITDGIMHTGLSGYWKWSSANYKLAKIFHEHQWPSMMLCLSRILCAKPDIWETKTRSDQMVPPICLTT